MIQGKHNYDRPTVSWLVKLAQILCVTAFVLVTLQSLRPALPSVTITHLDKIMHMLAYAILTALFAQALPRLRLLYVFLGPALYGAIIELVQAAMPYGRTGSWADLLANMLGGAVVIALWWGISWIKNRPSMSV